MSIATLPARLTTDAADRIAFDAAPVIEPVALLRAVSSLNDSLTVYVTAETLPPVEDFLDGEPEPPAPTYRVYAGEYGVLHEIRVIAVNDQSNPKTPDLHIKTHMGEVFIPKSTRHAPYYNYTKMYDASDEVSVTDKGSFMLATRH